MMTLTQLIDEPIMKYWDLPINASETQKAKREKALEGGEYLAAVKRDGAFYKFSKIDGVCKLQSRTVSTKDGNFVEKQDRVPRIMEELDKLPDGTVLIGEICFADRSKTSADIVSVMGCLPKKAIERQKGNPLEYYVFDILAYGGEIVAERKFEDRCRLMKKLSVNFEFNFVQFAKFYANDIPALISEWLTNGEEGAVLIKKDQPYHFGKRPAWSSIKIKQEILNTLDLVIMSYTAPSVKYTGKYPQSHNFWRNLKTGEMVEQNMYTEGGWEAITENFYFGYIGGLTLGAYKDGELVEVAVISNINDDVRAKAYADPQELIGTVVEVTAMQVDQARKSLRHAKLVRMRPDKAKEECQYHEIFS